MEEMNTNTLQVIAKTFSIFLSVKHPRKDDEWNSSELAIMVFTLYSDLIDEISDIDAQLIRHFKRVQLSDETELSMTLGIEKIGNISSFQLRCDDTIVTGWIEKMKEQKN